MLRRLAIAFLIGCAVVLAFELVSHYFRPVGLLRDGILVSYLALSPGILIGLPLIDAVGPMQGYPTRTAIMVLSNGIVYSVLSAGWVFLASRSKLFGAIFVLAPSLVILGVISWHELVAI